MNFPRGFSTIVSAIVYTIIEDRFQPGDSLRDFPHNRAVQFLLGQHGRMPDYLRWPLVVLTIGFDWSSVPKHGQRFHQMGLADRSKQIEAWRCSRLGPCRDLVKIYDSLVVFYWYSKVDQPTHRVEAQVEAEAGSKLTTPAL